MKLTLSSVWKTRLRRWYERLFTMGKKEHFSQFGEDAILLAYFATETWKKNPKALSRTGKIRIPRGFYVDVGAYSPKQHSNTYVFYRQGWRGINIDATPGSMASFRSVRKRDINLEVAVSSTEGELTFYTWGSPNAVNTLSKSHAEEWTRNFGVPPQEKKVRTRTLKSILSDHVPAGQKIDFLSVDVEGHDLDVLQSSDWERFRPKLVIVEQHQDDIAKILDSEVYRLMRNQGYRLYSWARPSLIFLDERIASSI